MTDLKKRSLIQMAALSAIAAAVLTGCGKKEEPAPAPAPEPAPAAAAAPAKPEPLKIAFAYVGPVGDGGWTYAHDQGRKAVEQEFGDKVVTSFVENVPESADAERVLRDMASQGNQLIFGTTFGYMEPMLKVAVIRNINSFTLGAQSSNPKIKTKVVWVNEWFNPPKETEAATSLINGGADVLFQNTDSPAVLKTAQDKGKRAFGWDSDMTAYGPKAHLGSAIINWAPYYIQATKEALDGTWKGGGGVWWGHKEGAIDMVSIAEDVPAETKARIDEIKAGLKEGTFAIWKGPIVGQDGKEILAKDVVADDKFLGGVNFYVKGVEGKVPGSK